MYVYMNIYIYRRVDIRVCICRHPVSTRIHAHIFVHVSCRYMNKHVYIHICICVCIYIYIYIDKYMGPEIPWNSGRWSLLSGRFVEPRGQVIGHASRCGLKGPRTQISHILYTYVYDSFYTIYHIRYTVYSPSLYIYLYILHTIYFVLCIL